MFNPKAGFPTEWTSNLGLAVGNKQLHPGATMGWLNLSLILLAAALPSVAAVSVAKERTPTSVTPGQLRGVIKASVERTQETLREEIKQTQEETETRISAILIEPLGQRIKSLEDKVNKAPPWWFPIVVSTPLGACVGFFLSRIAAHRDQTKADNEKKFTYVSFPILKNSLQCSLRKQAGEIDAAETIVKNVMESHLVKPDESLPSYAEFNERAYIEAVRSLNVNTFELNFPEEGWRRTRALAKLFQQHQSQTRNLNQCLSAFYVLLRPLSVYEEPDKNLLVKYEADSIRTLSESDAYQRDLETARQAITMAAGELKHCTQKLESELENVEKILGDVSPLGHG